MVSPAGFEPVYLPVMSGALLPIKLETHNPRLRWACYLILSFLTGFNIDGVVRMIKNIFTLQNYHQLWLGGVPAQSNIGASD